MCFIYPLLCELICSERFNIHADKAALCLKDKSHEISVDKKFRMNFSRIRTSLFKLIGRQHLQEMYSAKETSDSSERKDPFRSKWIWVCLMLGFVSLRNSLLSRRDPQITDIGEKLEIKLQFNFQLFWHCNIPKPRIPMHIRELKRKIQWEITA